MVGPARGRLRGAAAGGSAGRCHRASRGLRFSVQRCHREGEGNALQPGRLVEDVAHGREPLKAAATGYRDVGGVRRAVGDQRGCARGRRRSRARLSKRLLMPPDVIGPLLLQGQSRAELPPGELEPVRESKATVACTADHLDSVGGLLELGVERDVKGFWRRLCWRPARQPPVVDYLVQRNLDAGAPQEALEVAEEVDGRVRLVWPEARLAQLADCSPVLKEYCLPKMAFCQQFFCFDAAARDQPSRLLSRVGFPSGVISCKGQALVLQGNAVLLCKL
mmetsp:Transcript_1551/g.3498  ORF Transcript_1551/g.3498 Transcript_1551/m.3498 type:complete len:278 (-) Transcript_1551:361-1194(-)